MNVTASVKTGNRTNPAEPANKTLGLVLVISGLAVQLYFLHVLSWLVGLAAVLFGCIKLMPRGGSNAPKRLGKRKDKIAWEFKTPEGPKLFSMGDWAEISQEQFKRFDQLFALSSRSSTGCITGLLWLFVSIALFGWFVGSVAYEFENVPSWVSFFFPNLFIFSLVFAIGGNVSTWEPPGLRRKLAVYRNILPVLNQAQGLVVKAYAKYYEAYEGNNKIPYDLQVKANWEGASKDFYGLQFQVSENSVQSAVFPYFYAVIVAKRGYLIKQKLRGMVLPKPDVTTYSTEDDVEIVVMRQDPDARSDGYHTKPLDQIRITAGAMNMFEMLRPGK
jgi:hypothetical protein